MKVTELIDLLAEIEDEIGGDVEVLVEVWTTNDEAYQTPDVYYDGEYLIFR